MEDSKQTIMLLSDEIIDTTARQIALHTLMYQSKPYKNIFNNTVINDSENLGIMELINYYKAELTTRKGNSIEIPNEINPYHPYLNYNYSKENLEATKKIFQQEFRNEFQDEASEQDLKLQSLLMFRQYLRMIRRLLALTYFHSHQDEEFTTMSDGEIKHKFFGPNASQSVLHRISNGMHMYGYITHQLNIQMKNISPA